MTCIGCGLLASQGLCASCQRGSEKVKYSKDAMAIQGSPLDDVDDETMPDSDRRYHGSTVRDDL